MDGSDEPDVPVRSPAEFLPRMLPSLRIFEADETACGWFVDVFCYKEDNFPELVAVELVVMDPALNDKVNVIDDRMKEMARGLYVVVHVKFDMTTIRGPVYRGS